MKPLIKEDKIDFIQRCIADDMSQPNIQHCQLLWEQHEQKLETLKDLKEETVQHIWDVEYLLQDDIVELDQRGTNHDHTKLTLEALELLQSCLNGTGNWEDWKNYHFKTEDHHPEFWADKTKMPLTAIMEMVADGAAAQYARGYVRNGETTTFENQKQYYMTNKGWGEEMASILANQFMIYYNKLVELAPYEPIPEKEDV